MHVIEKGNNAIFNKTEITCSFSEIAYVLRFNLSFQDPINSPQKSHLMLYLFFLYVHVNLFYFLNCIYFKVK